MVNNKIDFDVFAEIIDIGAKMEENKLVNSAEGNISIKRDGLLYITPSRHSKKTLTNDVIAVIDEDGNQIWGSMKPSSETPMHRAAYGIHEGTNAVIHCHAPYLTAYAICNMPLKFDCHPELICHLKDIPCAPYPQDRSIMNRTVTMQQPKRAAAFHIRTITMTALLSAMAYVLAFAEFPVPLSPSFAKMDLSDFPALIGAFAFGPLSGLLIELVKNTLQLLTTSTGGIGEIANFLMGDSYVVAAGVIYKRRKTKKTALLACVAASFVMGIAAALANYFILLPLFETFMPLDQLIASFGAFLPFIHTKLDIVLFNALPFNILKGLVIGGFTMLTYKRLTLILKGR